MNGISLRHAVREPVRSPKASAPLLVMLHGLRSNEQDLMQLAPLLDERFFVVSARAPLRLGHAAYAWYNVQFLPDGYVIDTATAEQSRQLIIRFIRELPESYNVDPRRVFLTGFSQGGAMTVAAALSEPRLFAGTVPMSGRFIDELKPSIAPDRDMSGLPFLVVHGVYDDVIPIRHGRALRDELAGLPVALTYREYEMAHEVTADTMRDIGAWLTARLDAPDWRVDE